MSLSPPGRPLGRSPIWEWVTAYQWAKPHRPHWGPLASDRPCKGLRPKCLLKGSCLHSNEEHEGGEEMVWPVYHPQSLDSIPQLSSCPHTENSNNANDKVKGDRGLLFTVSHLGWEKNFRPWTDDLKTGFQLHCSW